MTTAEIGRALRLGWRFSLCSAAVIGAVNASNAHGVWHGLAWIALASLNLMGATWR